MSDQHWTGPAKVHRNARWEAFGPSGEPHIVTRFRWRVRAHVSRCKSCRDYAREGQGWASPAGSR